MLNADIETSANEYEFKDILDVKEMGNGLIKLTNRNGDVCYVSSYTLDCLFLMEEH